MPSIVALILCTLFVFWLLTLDRKISHEISFAVWIPTIWLLLIASKPLAIWFSHSAGEGEYGSPLDRNFIVLLIIIGVGILLKRRFSFSKAIEGNTWLILLTLYMLLSTLWSSVGIYTSFVRWVRATPALIMGFVLLTESNPREAMLSVLRRTTYILIPFSVLLIKYFPHYGVEYSRWTGELMWVGVTLQKNGIGRLCMISTFFLIWSFFKRRQKKQTVEVKYQATAEIFLLGLTLWLLKGPSIYAMSATALLSASAGFIVFAFILLLNRFKISPKPNLVTAIMLLCIIVGIVTVFTSGSTVASLTGSVGRDTTLTGRTDVWNSLLPVAMQRPLLGYGFGGFWTQEIRDHFMISDAHNGYLDVILDTGFLGLFLTTMFLLSSCHKAITLLKKDLLWSSLWSCFLFMAVIHNISESSISAFATHLTALLIFLAIVSTPSIEGEVSIENNENAIKS